MPKIHWSPEDRRKMSEKIKARYRDGTLTPPSQRPGVGAKISAAKMGHAVSASARAKISKSLQKAHKEGRSKSFSEEAHARARVALTGRTVTPDERERIGNSVKKRWADGSYEKRKHPRRCRETAVEDLISQDLVSLGFIRQHYISGPGFARGFYLDFFHTKKRICIEIDGPDHLWSDQIKARDAALSKVLAKKRIVLLRFTNAAVTKSPNAIVKLIRAHLEL